MLAWGEESELVGRGRARQAPAAQREIEAGAHGVHAGSLEIFQIA